MSVRFNRRRSSKPAIPPIESHHWDSFGEGPTPSGLRVVVMVKVARQMWVLVKHLICLTIIASVIYFTVSLVALATNNTRLKKIWKSLTDDRPTKEQNSSPGVLPPLEVTY